MHDFETGAPRKLHVGGRQVRPGWKLLNIQPGEGVDHVGDVKDLSQFADGSFDLVYGSHVIEHVPQSLMVPTLAGLHRILAPEGRLLVSVPDLQILCRLFLEPSLDRAARFHVMRMMFGGQVDPYDFHYVGLSEEILMDYLGAAGFKFCRRVDSFGLFDDTSDFKPYGVPISLNLVAYKGAPPA